MNLLRSIRYWWQRRTRGFDDSVTWSLDVCRESTWCGVPGSYCDRDESGMPVASPEARERWLADLDKMVQAFEWAAGDDMWAADDEQAEEAAREGIQLFAEHYFSLWT